MTILQSTYHFGPEIDIQYDEDNQKYLGKVLSRTGSYEVEGPGRTEVMLEIEHILAQEYNELLRSIEQEKGGKSRSNSVSAKEVKSNNIGRDISHNVSVGVQEFAVTSWSRLTKKQKLFVASFAGVRIVAPSRKLLKKKLQYQRNKRINIIMQSVRENRNKEEDRKRQSLKLNLKARKKKLLIRPSKKWTKKIDHSQGLDWKDKVAKMRMENTQRKEKAISLWNEK